MNLTGLIRKIIHPINIDIVKYPSTDLKRRIKLLNHFEINKVFDVGANKGQYAKQIRNLGFKGEIISFEPLSEVYDLLFKETLKDKKWKAYNYALGNKEETVKINVSENLFSSSILDMTNNLRESAPRSIYKNTEEIIVKKLDTIYNDMVNEHDVPFLKLDVQGFEENVIKGATISLSKIKGIQIEMSLFELYKGEKLFFEMMSFLKNHGYKLYSLENGFFNNETGQLLQVDGVFFK